MWILDLLENNRPRQILKMTFIQKMSMNEIASTLGLSKSAVQQYKIVGLKQLKERLSDVH